MRLLAKYETRSEADERAAFLKSCGIATHVTDMVSMRPNLAHQGQFRAGLWVVLEDQFRDATGLLENPDFEVQNSLSVDQMAHMENEGTTEARKTLLKWLLVTAVGLAAITALVTTLVPAG